MRLIDADKFVEYMAEKCDLNAVLDPIILAVIREAVKEQPTAYDVNKVVEQLKEWTFNADIGIEDGTMMNHNLIVSKTAIEIVKGGGVDGN
jgi:hypothetical protein